jgi:hypothetical protein
MKKGDVWISAVLYTAIMIAIISILLLSINPKIEEYRDRVTINYMIQALNSLDTTIQEVNDVMGNKRNFEIKISKGHISVLPKEEIIKYSITTNFEFSQPDQIIKVDKVNLKTEKEKGKVLVELWLNYSNTIINITTSQDSEGNEITITPGPKPYKIWIENLGAPENSPNNTIYISIVP